MTKLAHAGAALGAFALVATAASAAPSTGKIAFVRSVSGGERIWVASTNGSHQRAVTPKAMSAETPELSRDGKPIAFSRLVSTVATVQHDVYVVNADGSGLRRLTPAKAEETAPTWSPDGRRIAYEVLSGKQPWLVRPNGKGLHRITGLGAEYHPSWSR